MNSKFLKSLFSLLIALVAVFTFVSCDPEDDKPDIVVADGWYVKGAGTSFADLDTKGKLNTTRNEVLQTDRASLKEVFVAIEAGKGFSLVEVVGGKPVTYSPDVFAAVENPTNDEPKGGTIGRGTYKAGTTLFTVPNAGLYHVAIDTELKKIVIVEVKYWGLIGAATPGGWSNDTQLPAGTFNLTTMTFEATNVQMKKGDFKFRYSGGWKVELDTELDLGDGKKGVKINTNYGTAVAALVAGGDNINNSVAGVYTAKMVWTAGTGFVATMTKTGELPLTDYSAYNMGLVGNGIYNGAAVHNWDIAILRRLPTKSGNVYTWTYNGVKVTTAGSFKIRQSESDWIGLVIGYPQVVMAGAKAGDFDKNGDGNFVPKVNDASYNFVLTIDAATEIYTLTVTAAK